jgi:hypothetical protein
MRVSGATDVSAWPRPATGVPTRSRTARLYRAGDAQVERGWRGMAVGWESTWSWVKVALDGPSVRAADAPL